jgi:hypothetical protein
VVARLESGKVMPSTRTLERFAKATPPHQLRARKPESRGFTLDASMTEVSGTRRLEAHGASAAVCPVLTLRAKQGWSVRPSG